MSDLVFSVGVDTAEAVESINTYFEAVKAGAKNASKFLGEALGEASGEMQVEISFKNGEVVAKQVERIGKNTEKTKRAQEAVNGEIGKTVTAVKKQLETVKKLQNGVQKYQEGTKKVTKDWETLNKRAETLQRTLNQMNSSGNWFQRMADTIGKMGTQMLAANLASKALQAGFNAITGAIKGTIGAGIEMEQLTLQLEGFTGSAMAADQAMKDFVDIAVKTPMNLVQVAKAGKTLMGFGLEADKAKKATYQLAVVAGATGGDLNNLARNLGQIGTQGRAYTRDLQQFAIQGIPIWTELSKVVGKSTEEVKKMAQDGAIGLKEVEQALTNMTAAGTAFDMIAQEMQNTWQGQIEAMVSALQIFSGELVKGATQVDNAFGKPIQNTLKLVGAAFTTLAENMDTVAKVVGTLIGFFVGLTAAMAINSLITYISTAGSLVAAFQKMATAIGGVIKAQVILKALQGPAGWLTLAAGVGAAAGAYALLDQQLKQSNDSLGTVNDRLKQLHENMGTGAPSKYGTAVLGLKGKISDLEKEQANLLQTQQSYQAAGIKTTEIDRRLMEITKELTEAKKELKRLTENSGMSKEIQEAENLLLKYNELYEAAKIRRDELQADADEVSRQLKDETDKLDGLMERYKQLSERKKEAITEEINAKKEAITAEKEALKELLDGYKKNHETKMEQIKTEYDRKLEAIDLELDALGERTKSEEKLRNLRRKEIEQKLRSNDLSYKERLELQAQLERMDAQDKRAELLIQKKRLQKEKTTELKNEEDRYKDAVEKAKKVSEDKVGVLEDAIDKQEGLLKALEDAEKGLTRAIEDATTSLENRGQTMEDLYTALVDQVGKVDELKTQHGQINQELKTYEDKMAGIKRDAEAAAKALQAQYTALQKINNLKQQQNTNTGTLPTGGAGNLFPQVSGGYGGGGGGFSPGSFNFSGGPMQKGQTSWVNELGKEAFLTASGKLSMINAGAFSKWTAPESGTVIPAHLTKQLDIPAGGINLNKASTDGLVQATANGKGFGSVVKAIKQSAGSGGHTTNNVTVQAINPTQTASDMTVALNRARHNRYT